MSYYREIRKDELVHWLEHIDYEALTVEDFVDALLGRFDILTTSETPK